MFQILSTRILTTRILSTISNIVHKNIADKNIVHNFWRGMKIFSVYPNVGHSKSGRKLSPRVDKGGTSYITGMQIVVA